MFKQILCYVNGYITTFQLQLFYTGNSLGNLVLQFNICIHPVTRIFYRIIDILKCTTVQMQRCIYKEFSD